MMLYVGPHEGRAHPEVRLDEAGYPMPSNFIQQVPLTRAMQKTLFEALWNMGRTRKPLIFR